MSFPRIVSKHLVTKLDSVNKQFVPFEVSKPATRLTACSKSKFGYLKLHRHDFRVPVGSLSRFKLSL